MDKLAKCGATSAVVFFAYAGSRDAIVSPLDDAINSLLMKRPVGWFHLMPFGAVS